MPDHDEEHPGPPLWQSVTLLCCKGVIEGVMVILCFWFLVQVLFTKPLEGMDSSVVAETEHLLFRFWSYCPPVSLQFTSRSSSWLA